MKPNQLERILQKTKIPKAKIPSVINVQEKNLYHLLGVEKKPNMHEDRIDYKVKHIKYNQKSFDVNKNLVSRSGFNQVIILHDPTEMSNEEDESIDIAEKTEKEKALENREKALKIKEADSEETLKKIQEKDKSIKDREKQISDREKAVEEKEKEWDEKLKSSQEQDSSKKSTQSKKK